MALHIDCSYCRERSVCYARTACCTGEVFHHLIFKCDLCSPITAFYWTFCFEQSCLSCSFLRIDYFFHLFHSCRFVYWQWGIVSFFSSLPFLERLPNTKRSECTACIWNTRLYSFSDVPAKYLVHLVILICNNNIRKQNGSQWTKMSRTTIVKWCLK